MTDKNIFWTDDIRILYKNNGYLEFIPTNSMSRMQQLNALTRFFLYLLILSLITKKPSIWIKICIVLIVFIIVINNIYKSDENGQMRELYSNKCSDTHKLNDDNNKYDNSTDDVIIETGIADNTNDTIAYDSYNGSKSKKDKILYNYDENKKYNNATCRKPTPDNPFMNPTLNDIGENIQPVACNVDDENIKEQMVNMFNKNLFRDVSDLYEKQNSQRQYYTVPSMNPPDTIGLGNWLYNSNNICKVDQSKCKLPDDLKYNRGNNFIN